MQKVGDLARGHHLITSETHTNRGHDRRGGLKLWGWGGHARQDAPNPADIARATRDVFEDVPRTSTDILVFSLQKLDCRILLDE
jgi:hypothetical protein